MLELKNVCKTFSPGTPDEKRALIDISLTVPDGDFVTSTLATSCEKLTHWKRV